MSDCYASNDEDGLAVCAAHRWSMAGVAPGGLCIEGRLIKAEAAVQRVRELHSPTEGFNGYLWCSAHCESTADGDPTDYPCETIRALDGEQ